MIHFIAFIGVSDEEVHEYIKLVIYENPFIIALHARANSDRYNIFKGSIRINSNKFHNSAL